MKKVLLSDLKNGMITAEDVFSLDGQLVVPKGIALTENLIARIFSFDIFSIRVEDVVLSSNLDVPSGAEMSYAQKVKSSPEFAVFQEDFRKNVEKLEFAFNSLIERNSEFDPSVILEDTLKMINHRSSPTGIMDLI